MMYSVFVCVCIIYFQICLKPALCVIDGRDAEPGEFPFAVRIATHTKNIYPNRTEVEIFSGCSGAALTATWSLTAAHCADIGPYKTYSVNLEHYTMEETGRIIYGSPHLKLSENNQYSLILEGIKPARKLASATRVDIALLRTEPISVERFARLSSMEYTALIGHEVTLMGFGLTRVAPDKFEVDFTSNLDKPLQVIEKALVINCDKFTFAEKMGIRVCMVPKCGSSEFIGGGDSGSPAVHKTGIVAVASKSSDMHFAGNRPKAKPIARVAGYVPVSLYIDWIVSIITNNGTNKI